LFLHLVFKALKKDHDIHRVRVFSKRLLQVRWTNWKLCTIKSPFSFMGTAYFKHLNEEDIKWRELHIVRLGLILQKFQT
jgi:hypothetical protein